MPHFTMIFGHRVHEFVLPHVRDHVDHLGCIAANQHDSPVRRKIIQLYIVVELSTIDAAFVAAYSAQAKLRTRAVTHPHAA